MSQAKCRDDSVQPNECYPFIASAICNLTLREFQFLRFDGLHFFSNSKKKVHVSSLERLDFVETRIWRKRIDPNPRRIDGGHDLRYNPKNRYKIKAGVVHQIRMTGTVTKTIYVHEKGGRDITLDPADVIPKFNILITSISRNIELYNRMPNYFTPWQNALEEAKKFKGKLEEEFPQGKPSEVGIDTRDVDIPQLDRFSFLYENLITAEARAAKAAQEFSNRCRTFMPS